MKTALWANHNDVICVGLEQKLGIHGSPTCVLNLGENDDCIGYLCGEENKGLAHMFQMMNSARINVGVAGIGIAATAYLNALAYCQGKNSRNRSNPEQIRRGPDNNPSGHPRMLLWMKAAVDGMRSMAYTTGYWLDLANESENEKDRARYNYLVDFMTPIIKAYCTDT